MPTFLVTYKETDYFSYAVDSYVIVEQASETDLRTYLHEMFTNGADMTTVQVREITIVREIPV